MSVRGKLPAGHGTLPLRLLLDTWGASLTLHNCAAGQADAEVEAPARSASTANDSIDVMTGTGDHQARVIACWSLTPSICSA